ncbi:MAG: L-tyrosine/L-tryptophan isonitrile synthase family protein, partial [Candidatus Levyibacteriota bacterium]
MLTDFQIITQENSYISPLWLRENFSEIIIFKDFDTQSLPYYPRRNLPKKIIESFNTEMLTPRIIYPSQDAVNTSSAILSILLNANIRRGSLTTVEPYMHTFLSKINYFVERNEPIHLVLPTIPHKKQSPITTGHTMDFVDLGEYLLMSQLHTILLSIEKIYNPGAKITLLSDGLLLADIFTNNDKSLIHNYIQKLNHLKNQFNLNGLVNIEGLDNLIKDRELFAQVHDDIKRLLYTLYKKDAIITEGLDILKKAMLVFNLPFDHSLEEHFSLIKIPLQKIPYNIRALVE